MDEVFPKRNGFVNDLFSEYVLYTIGSATPPSPSSATPTSTPPSPKEAHVKILLYALR
jgi:hypothetical protein